jgi:hypothetical protein
MSIAPRVLELRLSFAWTETWSTLVGIPAPLAFMGDPDSFASRYDQIRQQMRDLGQKWLSQDQALQASHTGDDRTLAAKRAQLKREFLATLRDPKVLTPPWPWLGRQYVHHFWQYYLGNIEPNYLSGSSAWRYVVPLRAHVPVRIGSPWPPGGFKCIPQWDGLLYPHGVAIVLTLRLLFKEAKEPSAAGLGIKLATDRGLRVRNSEEFPVQWPGEPQDKLKLDLLANRLLDYLRERALGTAADQPGSRPTQPITTTATIVQGRGGSPTEPIAPNSLLHEALEGLCSWNDQWQKVQPRPLSEANLLVSQAPAGHMVYHLARGRAVWMPDYFNSTSGRDQHKLSCYHRNLTLVTLQTEMLAQAVVLYTDYLDREEEPPEAVRSLARYAAIRLGHLYETARKGSKKYTYNSASPRCYLKDNGYVPIINQARASFAKKLPPLAYTPWS